LLPVPDLAVVIIWPLPAMPILVNK
jgi:hypothetical protein